MTKMTEHISVHSEILRNTHHFPERYIEFYGWFNPERSSTDALGTVSSTDVFGNGTYLPAVSAHESSTNLFISSDLGYQLITVGLFFLYFFMVFRFGSELMQYPKLLAGSGGKREHRSENDIPATEVSIGITLCGLFGFSLALFKLLDLFGGQHVSQAISTTYPWILITATAVVIFILLLFQKLILHITGALTFSNSFTGTLVKLRRSFQISSTVAALPVILLLALSEGLWSYIFAWTLIVITLLALTAYITKSFLLFVGQKVSILFWILYLCAVETVPLALIVISIVKYTAH